jgi:hypothetical protein
MSILNQKQQSGVIIIGDPKVDVVGVYSSNNNILLYTIYYNYNSCANQLYYSTHETQ